MLEGWRKWSLGVIYLAAVSFINYTAITTAGMNLNLAGKLNTGKSFDTNVKQYSIGAVYFLN